MVNGGQGYRHELVLVEGHGWSALMLVDCFPTGRCNDHQGLTFRFFVAECDGDESAMSASETFRFAATRLRPERFDDNGMIVAL